MNDTYIGPNSGFALRDEALETVKSHNQAFHAAGLDYIATLPESFITGEQVRELLTQRGVTPNHHNTWGALIMAAVRKGMLLPTGTHTPMSQPRSHGRQTPVYRVNEEACHA